MEWVSDNFWHQILKVISWWEQVTFSWDEDDICFVLDQHIFGF